MHGETLGERLSQFTLEASKERIVTTLNHQAHLHLSTRIAQQDTPFISQGRLRISERLLKLREPIKGWLLSDVDAAHPLRITLHLCPELT